MEVTLEHAPPRSLGGAPVCLTCKSCNNKASLIDHHAFLGRKARAEWSAGHGAPIVVDLFGYKKSFRFVPQDRATVHPRVILQKALAYNAAAVIAYHNHPSGVEEPSLSDMSLTSRTKDLLQEIEVRLLDHIVVPRFRDRQHGRPRPDLTHRGPGAAH